MWPCKKKEINTSTKDKHIEFYKLDDPLNNYNDLKGSSQYEFKKDVDKLAMNLKKDFFRLNNSKLLRNKVIGIQGKWGIGKTSFINIVLDKLSDICSGGNWYENFNKEDNIIRLNPWKFSKKDNLPEYFISEIRNKIINNKTEESLLEKTYSFNKYISLFNGNKNLSTFFILIYMFSNTKKRILSICSFVSIIVALLVLAVWKYRLIGETDLIQSIHKISIITESTVIGIWIILGILILILYNFLLNIYKDSTKSDAKKSIDKLLIESNKRYICIIDDVDRLSEHQIYQVFTSVKEIIDFPNILFLIVYDKDIVKRAFLRNSLKVNEEGIVQTTVSPFDQEIDCLFLDKIINEEIHVKTYTNNYIKDKLLEMNLSY